MFDFNSASHGRYLSWVIFQVNALYKSADDLTYISALPEEMRQPSVLCHGELSAEKIIFGGNGKLVEIRHWDVSS